MGSPFQSQQRMLARIPGDAMEIEWDVRAKRPVLSRQKKKASQLAVVLDVSVGGASVLAPADRELRPGTKVRIEANGAAGLVRVRWASGSEDSEMTVYGVDYLALEPELREYLLQPVQKSRNVSEEDWRPHP